MRISIANRRHLAVVAVFVIAAASDAQGQKLLISELVVQPTTGEFVEIYNPNSVSVMLDDVYLSDMTTYHLISVGIAASASDFVVGFPPGSSIAPFGVVVVALDSAAAFSTNYGMSPDFDFEPSDSGAPAMIGDYGTNSGLTNGDEVVVLFHWDGVTDLVSDLDYVLYGNQSDAVDKTGVTVGASTYASDTAAGSQDIAAAAGAGEAVQRINVLEGTQVQSGGNGVLGGDETSEDLAATFAVAAPPTPGIVPFSVPSVPALGPMGVTVLGALLLVVTLCLFVARPRRADDTL